MFPQISWNTEIKTETRGLTQSFFFQAFFSDKIKNVTLRDKSTA